MSLYCITCTCYILQNSCVFDESCVSRSSIVQYCPVLSSIVQYCPVLSVAGHADRIAVYLMRAACRGPVVSSIVQYCPVLSSIVQYCPVLSSIVQYCPVLSSIVTCWSQRTRALTRRLNRTATPPCVARLRSPLARRASLSATPGSQWPRAGRRRRPVSSPCPTCPSRAGMVP